MPLLKPHKKHTIGRWIVAGRGYMGGGTVAAALGISPYGTPLDAYAVITGEMDVPVSIEDEEFFETRKEWEPIAFRRFERKTGIKIIRTNEHYTDSVWPWAKAEIDFETEHDENGEVKTSKPEMRWMWGTPGLDEPPIYVTAQVMWGLSITGKQVSQVMRFDLDAGDLYPVHRDEETILVVRDGIARFWFNHIEKRRPPLPVDVDDILRLYVRGTERAVEATDEVREALAARAKAVSNIKLQNADQLKAELVIKQFMRDASVLTINGKQVATWKADSRGIRIFRQK